MTIMILPTENDCHDDHVDNDDDDNNSDDYAKWTTTIVDLQMYIGRGVMIVRKMMT